MSMPSITRQLFAAFGAFAITSMLLFSSFASDTQVQAVAGIVA